LAIPGGWLGLFGFHCSFPRRRIKAHSWVGLGDLVGHLNKAQTNFDEGSSWGWLIEINGFPSY